MTLISQAEYARHINSGRAHVTRLIQSKRILLHNGKIDPEEADRMLSESADPAREPFKKSEKGKQKQSKFYEARTERELIQTKLAQLELDEKMGKLVEADKVKEAAFQTYRRFRDAIMQIPARIGPIVAAEKKPHAVRLILEKELRKALENLANGK